MNRTIEWAKKSKRKVLQQRMKKIKMNFLILLKIASKDEKTTIHAL